METEADTKKKDLLFFEQKLKKKNITKRIFISLRKILRNKEKSRKKKTR